MASPAPIRSASSDVEASREALEAMKLTASPCLGITGQRWEMIRAIEIGRIRFGLTTYDRDLQGRPVGVPVWAFGR